MRNDRIAIGIADWVTGHPWKTLFLTLVWVFILAYGGKNLTFTSDYRAFFSDENPQLLAFEKVEKTYTKFDNVLYVLAPSGGDIYTQNTLEAVAFLTEGSWLLPYSLRVDSLSNYQHSYAEEDDLIVEDLVGDPSSLDDDGLARIKQIAEAEPLLFGQLVSYKGHATGVNVTIQLPGKDPTREVPEVTQAARKLADEFRTVSRILNYT